MAGTPEALDQLAKNGNVIQIPSEALKANDDYEWTLELPEYLPEDIKLATDVTNRVQVKAVVIPLGSRSLNLSVTNLEVKNLDESQDLAYDERQVIVNVKASASALENLTVDEIKASIDLSGLGEGEHTVPVEIVLPSQYELVEDVEIGLHLTEKMSAKES